VHVVGNKMSVADFGHVLEAATHGPVGSHGVRRQYSFEVRFAPLERAERLIANGGQKHATLGLMARIAVRLILAALLALISAQAATPVAFERERPVTAIWHRLARRTVLAARPARAARVILVPAPDYSFSVHSPGFDFGLFVRPPPFLLP
jgi:hypothetical protein